MLLNFEIENLYPFKNKQEFTMDASKGKPYKTSIIIGDNNSGKTAFVNAFGFAVKILSLIDNSKPNYNISFNDIYSAYDHKLAFDDSKLIKCTVDFKYKNIEHIVYFELNPKHYGIETLRDNNTNLLNTNNSERKKEISDWAKYHVFILGNSLFTDEDVYYYLFKKLVKEKEVDNLVKLLQAMWFNVDNLDMAYGFPCLALLIKTKHLDRVYAIKNPVSTSNGLATATMMLINLLIAKEHKDHRDDVLVVDDFDVISEDIANSFIKFLNNKNQTVQTILTARNFHLMADNFNSEQVWFTYYDSYKNDSSNGCKIGCLDDYKGADKLTGAERVKRYQQGVYGIGGAKDCNWGLENELTNVFDD